MFLHSIKFSCSHTLFHTSHSISYDNLRLMPLRWLLIRMVEEDNKMNVDIEDSRPKGDLEEFDPWFGPGLCTLIFRVFNQTDNLPQCLSI